jgi:PIN domain nuclease of toxin-antitoxin system
VKILLLDTNTLYWWLEDPKRLTSDARGVIEDPSSSVMVSSAVPWELAIKTNLGRLDAQALLANWDAKLDGEGFSELPIESSHAIRAGLLPPHHRDPFDRMLVAQAQATGWPIVSADRVFDNYGVRRIW